MEAAGVAADKLGERPLEGVAAADGGMRVALERRLVHRHHHPRRRRRVRHCSARTLLNRSGCLPRQEEEKFGGNFEHRTKSRAALFLSFFVPPLNFC